MTWEPEDGSLRIEGSFTRLAGGQLRFERGMAPYFSDAWSSPGPPAPPTWQKLAIETSPLLLPSCTTSCRVRYRFALREAALAFGDLDWAAFHGELLEAPPATWLLGPAPPATGPPNRLRFSVSTPPGSGFATGVLRAATTATTTTTATATTATPTTPAAPAWELDVRDLWSSPYSAFGAMTTHSLAVPGGTLELAIEAGATAVPRDDIVRWVERRGRAVGEYFGRFPMPGALVLLAVRGSSRIGGGRTLSGGGGTVVLQLGSRSTAPRFEADWVLVHELVHLGFPSVPRQQLWAQEGVASYVEPFARVRAGLLDEAEAWRGLLEGLPSGLPQAGDRGLDHTPTWGRIYWGGALYWFLCDLELRKRSRNQLGLEHALRGIVAAGGNNAARWPLRRALELGDRAVGLSVLVPQYEAMKDAPYPVDLDALAAQLGVTLRRGEVIFDDTAPLAAIRRAITFGSDPKSTPSSEPIPRQP